MLYAVNPAGTGLAIGAIAVAVADSRSRASVAVRCSISKTWLFTK